MNTKPKYTLRVEQTLLDKMAYIAESNSRSSNKEIEFIMKKYIAEYEKQHGEIPIPSQNK